MSKRRPSIAPGQFAFSFDVPAPARAEASLAGLDRRVSATVASILKDDERDRYGVASAMSRLLDEDVSKAMLDQYAAESKDGFNISFARMLALISVTDRYDLLDARTREIGASVLVGPELITAELGHIERQMANLRARRRAIENSAPMITAGRGKP